MSAALWDARLEEPWGGGGGGGGSAGVDVLIMPREQEGGRQLRGRGRAHTPTIVEGKTEASERPAMSGLFRSTFMGRYAMQY